ncbi:MAG: alpha/beta fold hydrolase [Actinophytocola sp.]|uniref:alpha/beta fold hydrolase n=1 Tax=Actinophytocola sp. TaxID=1872138 RepID=UPI001324C566|nr:alpha/beta hydrolase [Actinophytocola sp.]MPZ83502.1 alpha/beta fold hydrolase [Actinophytocola sp.]
MSTNKVTSADGTLIAYDLLGSGSPVVVVGGATCDRAKMSGISSELARHYAVVNYDRRGRGDSGDTAPYAVEREVEDLAALIADVGGSAALYGHSSGAGLVLHALAAGLPVTRAVLHEPPYSADAMAAGSREYAASLASLLDAGRRDDALALFFSITGLPTEMVSAWRAEPWWAGTAALAPTLAYDSAVMGDAAGGTVPFESARAAVAPSLVLVGGASPAWMTDTDRALAEAMPAGSLRVLEGEEHVVEPSVLVPVLVEFLAELDAR